MAICAYLSLFGEISQKLFIWNGTTAIPVMANFDDLFRDTAPYKIEGQPHSADGGHYVHNDLTSLGDGRRIFVLFEDGEDDFYARVYVMTPSIARPSARVPSPKKRLLMRTVGASIAPLDDYIHIYDAVRDIAAKLHENYMRVYQTNLDVQLEGIITAALQSIGAQPPGET